MSSGNQELWIKTAYELCAVEGINSLKIEPLAKLVGKSKSSFYHHFADLELFMENLLNYHLEQSKLIAEKEKNAKTVDPELISILVEHKIDLLFNRQLRINQNIKSFAETLNKSNQLVGNAFVMVWVKDLNLQLTEKQLEAIFSLALENFYLQINSENIHVEWLKNYFSNLKKIAQNFA